MPNALLAIASRMERRFAKALISRGAELGCYKSHINQLEAERDELQAKLDEYDTTHIELPKDADGVSIHVGDCLNDRVSNLRVVVARIEHRRKSDGTQRVFVHCHKMGDRLNQFTISPLETHHVEPVDTAESIVRELTLGSITEEQAITRIEALHGNP